MEVIFYKNKKNPNKYIEVHADGYGHYSIRQIINNRVRNYVGDGKLHRHSKRTLNEILEDYDITWSTYLNAACSYCGHLESYPVFGEEYDGLCKYLEGKRNGLPGSTAGMIQDLIPTVPAWIRAGAIDGFCMCPRCAR